MSIIFLLIPLSVLIATGFLIAFIWAVRSGQYEDTCTPSMRMLMPDSAADQPLGADPIAAHEAKTAAGPSRTIVEPHPVGTVSIHTEP